MMGQNYGGICMLKLLLAGVVALGSLSSMANELKEAGTFVPPKPVESKSDMRRHFGLSAGYNIPEGDAQTTPEIGVSIGFQPYIPFGVGVEVSMSKFEDDHREDYRRTTALGYATYNFGGTIPVIRGSYIGIAAGAAFLNHGTELAAAPLMGFDVPLSDINGKQITVGVNAKYLLVDSARDSLITNAALKFWY
jgi:hypothetical protein